MPEYSSDVLDAARQVTTATFTTVLLKKGLRNVWIRGARPVAPGSPRVAGPAFTLRFLPAREDLANPASWSAPTSTRAAIEAMPSGCIVVADAREYADAGIFGDILCARMVARRVSALVTDGALRDLEGVVSVGLPAWCAGAAAPPAAAGLTFADWQLPVGCGGVAVLPGDLIVADRDGAVVVPAALVDEVIEVSLEQERLEQWIMDEVQGGVALPGLYPPDEASLARYDASRD